MLKRLRTAHPIAYCISAELVFLGGMFLVSFVLTIGMLLTGTDFSTVDGLHYTDSTYLSIHYYLAQRILSNCYNLSP